MGLIKEAKEKAAKKAIDDMTKHILNEVKKELNEDLKEVGRKIHIANLKFQKDFEKVLQKTLEDQTEHFNKQLEQQGSILKQYIKDTIKEENGKE